ncbi:hypothetical protein D3C85_1802080 [compost metagenome]
MNTGRLIERQFVTWTDIRNDPARTLPPKTSVGRVGKIGVSRSFARPCDGCSQACRVGNPQMLAILHQRNAVVIDHEQFAVMC